MSSPSLVLASIRAEVLSVHRTLLEAEQVAYERLFGRVSGSGELLTLAIHDPWFGWLQPVTALIAAMDELVADDTPDLEQRVSQFRATARELLRADETGNDFHQRYFELVQGSPDVALAHGRLVKALNGP